MIPTRDLRFPLAGHQRRRQASCQVLVEQQSSNLRHSELRHLFLGDRLSSRDGQMVVLYERKDDKRRETGHRIVRMNLEGLRMSANSQNRALGEIAPGHPLNRASCTSSTLLDSSETLM
jgi:hypothetical protein